MRSDKLAKIKKGIKIFLVITVGVPVSVIGAILLFWYLTASDETITTGEIDEYSIGESKKQIFTTLSEQNKTKNTFGIFYLSKDKFEKQFPGKSKSLRLNNYQLHDIDPKVYFYITDMSFGKNEFNTVRHFDQWRIQWSEFFRYGLTFYFENDKVVEIRKTRILFSE